MGLPKKVGGYANGGKQVSELRPPRRKKKPKVEVIVLERDVALALLSCFAMLDDVFTEDDAFDDPKKKIGFGRLYEEWKRCRGVLDPEFKTEQLERPRKWLHKQVAEARSTSRRATGSKTSSSGTKPISAKNPPRVAKKGKR